jgi:hypothetical protein
MALCAFCKVEETMLYESAGPVCLRCVKRGESQKDSPTTVHATLVCQLAEATRLASSASMELNAITCDIPSGLPSPDGTQRIHGAANALKAARKEAVAAHNRLEDYLNHRIVPEDLKGA